MPWHTALAALSRTGAKGGCGARATTSAALTRHTACMPPRIGVNQQPSTSTTCYDVTFVLPNLRVLLLGSPPWRLVCACVLTTGKVTAGPRQAAGSTESGSLTETAEHAGVHKQESRAPQGSCVQHGCGTTCHPERHQVSTSAAACVIAGLRNPCSPTHGVDLVCSVGNGRYIVLMHPGMYQFTNCCFRPTSLPWAQCHQPYLLLPESM